MRKLFTLITLLLCAFSVKAQEQEQEMVDVTANFTYCWNPENGEAVCSFLLHAVKMCWTGTGKD